MNLAIFPPLNASLNAATALFLILGYFLVKRRIITGHKVCMLLATFTSTVFLGCYIYYHANHGVTRFPGTGPIRALYFTILTTHTILAAVQVPLIFMTLSRALRSQFTRHIAIARVTLPIWLYVSVTGVVIYWMLYRTQYINIYL